MKKQSILMLLSAALLIWLVGSAAASTGNRDIRNFSVQGTPQIPVAVQDKFPLAGVSAGENKSVKPSLKTGQPLAVKKEVQAVIAKPQDEKPTLPVLADSPKSPTRKLGHEVEDDWRFGVIN